MSERNCRGIWGHVAAVGNPEASSHPIAVTVLLAVVLLLFGCGEPEADRLLVGAECSSADDCLEDQECLTQFKGGYCGYQGCTSHADCPEASSCVVHDDGNNYCFRDCVDKAECNANRDPDNEANCSSNSTLVDDTRDIKVCAPPSS